MIAAFTLGKRALFALLPTLCVLPALHGNRCVAQAAPKSGDTKSSARVPLEAMQSLLAELDQLFTQGDVNGYLAKFQPDHDGALAMLGLHLERLCALTGPDRQRTTQVVAGPMSYDSRTVVRLRHVISWPEPASAIPNANRSTSGETTSGADQKLVEDTYLAVHLTEAGRVVPTFAIEMPPAMHCVSDAKFRCPPCNYEIGGVAGFLCVPLRREQGLALESASFYLIGTDVVVDVHVQIPGKQETAKEVVRTLAEAFAKMEPSAKVGIPSDWVPPMHRAAPPDGMDSARLVVELPLDHETGGGDITVFHVVAFGGVQHVLMARSCKQSWQQHRTAINKLFASYMLLEIDCGDAELATRPLRAHTGGSFQGATYRNERYNVSLAGPENWKPEHRIGGSAFRARWSGPNGSQLWLIGQEVPAGMSAWTSQTAERWLNYQCNKLQLQQDSTQQDEPASTWQKDAFGSLCRTVVLSQTLEKHLGQPQRRLLHLRMYPDLLLVVDGFGGTDADEAAVRAAIRTLTRK